MIEASRAVRFNAADIPRSNHLKPTGTPRRDAALATSKQIRLRVVSDDPMYPGLKKLKMKGRELQSLPMNLFNIHELEVLDLSPERETCLHFQLGIIPKEIANLAALKVLVLDTNSLQKLPEEACLLTQLERLALSSNQLSTLPSNFGKLTNLLSLHCSSNQFTEIPAQVFKLVKLRFLDFSNNIIGTISQDIGKLTELDSLMLCYNRIEVLPPNICTLKNLSTLWLSENQLRELPRNFGDLEKLDWSWWCTSSVLDGNPLKSPPLDIAKLGPLAIKQYFNQTNKPTVNTK